MPPFANQSLSLQDWTVLSLRPRGQHASLRAAARRFGARLFAISPFDIVLLDNPDVRATLAQALTAQTLLFTSPNAVDAVMALAPLPPPAGQSWLAVGAGTQRALARHGITATAPDRMDSEGLLGLPALANLAGQRIALLTAPGGRGLLAPALRARGAEVIRVNVYARRTLALTASRKQALCNHLQRPERLLLALSSGEALAALQAQLPGNALTAAAVIAASPRLAEMAHAAGFTRIACARNARPGALLRAAANAFV